MDQNLSTLKTNGARLRSAARNIRGAEGEIIASIAEQIENIAKIMAVQADSQEHALAEIRARIEKLEDAAK